MTRFTLMLWTLGIVLHLSLLAALLLRHLMRRFPAFTGLIVFYLVRSLLLFLLAGHVAPPVYATIYSGLSWMDLLLQVVVAWELSGALRSPAQMQAGPRWLRRAAIFAGCVLLAAAVSWSLSSIVPASPRAPMDRGVVFAGMLMLAVAAISLRRWSMPAAVGLMAGFCLLSLTSILCQVERTLAAFHRDAAAFQSWSYPVPLVYLMVVGLWLLGLLFVPSGLHRGDRPRRRPRLQSTMPGCAVSCVDATSDVRISSGSRSTFASTRTASLSSATPTT